MIFLLHFYSLQQSGVCVCCCIRDRIAINCCWCFGDFWWFIYLFIYYSLLVISFILILFYFCFNKNIYWGRFSVRTDEEFWRSVWDYLYMHIHTTYFRMQVYVCIRKCLANTNFKCNVFSEVSCRQVEVVVHIYIYLYLSNPIKILFK